MRQTLELRLAFFLIAGFLARHHLGVTCEDSFTVSHGKCVLQQLFF